MAGKEKTFRFEYTTSGSRDALQRKNVAAFSLKAALSTFHTETAGKDGVEIKDVYQHVLTGSVQTIRKTTLKPV